MSTIESFKIETAAKKDINEIADFELRCFDSDSFSQNQFAYLVTKAKSKFVIIRDQKQIIAYLILLTRKNSKSNRIYSIAIAKDYRGKGIAKKLLIFAEDFTKNERKEGLTLEVKESNETAIQLYLKFGFVTKGIKPNYYEDGSNALLMTKKIFF